MEKMQIERTTVSIRQKPTKSRFDKAKPDGLSADEFILVLLNRWEGRR